jgi:hypothetical protein
MGRTPTRPHRNGHEMSGWDRPRYHGSVEQFALEFDLTPERRIYSVSEINAAIRAMLDAEFPDIWVSG